MLDFSDVDEFEQVIILVRKRKMIMSPSRKIEMSPLIDLEAVEVPYEGDIENDGKRSRAP